MQGECSDPTKKYVAMFYDPTQNEYEEGNVLVKQYAPTSGETFDVILYRFFVESIKSIQDFGQLSTNELQQITLNLQTFKTILKHS